MCLALLVTSSSAAAMQLQRGGDTLFLTGRIRAGDDQRFEQAVADSSVRQLELNVAGGDMRPTAVIARRVRALRLATIVDASRASCNSACSTIFAAGIRRYYVNADGIRDGLGGKNDRGLGFHQATHAGGTATEMTLFREMGVPAGADLVMRSPNETMFFISGPTALSRGIATDLARPR
jgi:hypothetical protein